MAPHDYKAPRRTNDSPIAQARINKGWTQKQLAEAIGTPWQTINKWETGVRNPKMQALMKIADALEVDWATLIPQK